jgi:mitochondrial ATPase complex subunit ATP10
MSELRILPALRRAVLHPATRPVCAQCRHRTLATSTKQRQAPKSAPKSAPKPAAKIVATPTKSAPAPPPPEELPDGDQKDPEKLFQLNRPIGTALPPMEGENAGIDFRTVRERRNDLVDYDKHLERRKQLYVAIQLPSFQFVRS